MVDDLVVDDGVDDMIAVADDAVVAVVVIA